MKYKTKEAIVGYLFATPIILTVLVFTIYPIIAAFYYSLTDYQPLEARKYTYVISPYDALEIHTGILREEAKNYTIDEMLEYFDPVSFVEVDVGVKLSDEEKKLVKEYFDSLNLLNDYREKKLPNEIKIADFMKKYMNKHGDRFIKYIPKFVGLKNFRDMFKDMYFYTSFWNAFLYSIIVVPIQTLLAVILAVAANSKIKAVNFFKSVFFLPAITSSAALSMIFWLIYSKPGVLNKILVALFGRFGFQPIDYLNEPRIALFAIMAMNIWSTAGYFMVTFLAGLQDIPTESQITIEVIDFITDGRSYSFDDPDYKYSLKKYVQVTDKSFILAVNEQKSIKVEFNVPQNFPGATGVFALKITQESVSAR